MDRFVSGVDKVSGLFLGAIAALTFSEAALRYLFSMQIPDWYNLACMFQGIAIFWGISSTTYEGKHIVVDALWEAVGPRWRRGIDIFADIFTAVFLAGFSWMLLFKVESVYASNQSSSDLRFQLWPFFAVAALGIVAAFVLAVIRLRRTLGKAY